MADRALVGLALRQIRFGGLAVTSVAIALTALVVATAETIVTDRSNLASLEALASNPAIRTLFGPPIALDSVGGFTVWRTATPLAVIVGVWTIVAATRITRGEEDAGRWSLLLSGHRPLRDVLSWTAGVLAVAPLAAGVGAAAALASAGTAGALIHGAGIVMVGWFFVGCAVLGAQVFASRSAATTGAVAVLGATLLARMIGDGVEALGWLRWVSPFGLLELSRPYAGNRWSPLVLLLVAAVALMAAALVVAGRRDVGSGVLVAGPRRSSTVLLGSVGGFAVRRLLVPLTAWAIALGAYYLLIGLVADSALTFLRDNPEFSSRAGQAGFADLASVEGYTATLFAILAMPVGGFVAVRLAAFADAETDRRLTPLVAAPVTRLRLVGAEITATLLGAVALTVLSGAAAWAGVTLSGNRDLSLAEALAGTLNMLPIVLLCVGTSVLALGWAPRGVTLLGGLPGGGGFLLYVLALDAGAPAWVVNCSPFAHLAAVPLESPNWLASGVMSAFGVAATVVGALRFGRRDLRG
ncbi:polyketide antibiotic transporter [Cryptosporangium japonicum]|uniref:ABC transporter membrane-spanning protein n=1 Tax=Cryptosporangium japonicum TaxID=80872 RepID=A0ABN0TFT6_9ACTN